MSILYIYKPGKKKVNGEVDEKEVKLINDIYTISIYIQ